MSQHALIKWCEDPPKWDVVNVKEIRSNREDENDDTDTEEGSLVEARYGKSWFPAGIIKWGKHAQLTKRLELLAIEQFGSDENEEEIPSKGRRITEKVYEKEAEEIPSAKAPSQKAMVKRHEKARTVATLDALDKEKDDPACKEVCSQCLEHKIVIARQEGEIRRLKETNVAKESMAYCAQQVEICTQQMQLQVAESQKQLAKVVEGVGQRRAESSVLRDQLSTQTALRPAVRDAPSPVRTQDQVETIQQPAVDRAVRPNARSLPVPANVGPADMEDAVTISPNIRVPKRRYQTMDWTQPKKAIRDMLVAVFTRSTLAVSSLTGGRSNANSGNDVVPRPALDPVLLHELIAFLSIKIKIEKNAIRTIMRGKINDEVKMKRIADVKRLLQETQPQNRQQNNGAERQADSDDE